MKDMNFIRRIVFFCFAVFVAACSSDNGKQKVILQKHHDEAFVQNYSIKYYADKVKLLKVISDRNGYIQVLSSNGLLRPRAGQFLFPGSLVTDVQDKQTSDKKIAGIGTYKDQLIYIDDKALLSNAWAGKLLYRHKLPDAKIFTGGNDFSFLISDGSKLILMKDSIVAWEGNAGNEKIRDLKFDPENNQFWILGNESLWIFNTEKKTIEKAVSDIKVTCIELMKDKLIAGTTEGYLTFDLRTKKQTGEIQNKMPWTDLTTATDIDGNLWLGSTWGAMMLRKDGKYDYYASERWIPSDTIVSIAKGPENSVLILTSRGLAKICFKEVTLYDKAMFFEQQVRERHIRTGFNATVSSMIKGDVTSGSMEDSDNDGLWTSMYLAGETFRYAVTKSDTALQNVVESLDAMERLYTINGIPGFPSRSFERRGYKYDDEAWRRASDPEWDWKSTTSSDEAIGHIFAFGAIAELVDVPEIRNKAIMLIDTLMSTIVKNKFYMIDWNGEPTRWGRWNPEYVNGRPKMVGDRKINSSNIVAMLQTAYHFTKKEKYKEAAFMLMNNYGYFENLMRPMKEIGMAPADADPLSKDLSDGWNHSDDEMYYCGYWGLYRYALNDTLKAHFRNAIIDHWEAERPEKEGLWNIMTAIVGAKEIDLKEAVWYLQEYPLDLIDWSVKNSHRKDIELIQPNFRRQRTKDVLPPDELRIERHNANRFDLDGSNAGTAELSAGDIWLLPYWIGRYLDVISPPARK
jgi:hypothetical protein